ncbi:MAG: hypothetical protein O3A59_00215 [Nitrospirae bacterium]|nr:hypothetical protein [Nitrospirota bacterium]
MEKHLLRVGEAAEALNVSRWTIYRWIDGPTRNHKDWPRKPSNI